MLTSSSPSPDDNDSIRHVYLPFEFWIILETHFIRPTRYSVRQLIVELAATEEYFEHLVGGIRTIYNDGSKPENITTPDTTPVVTLRYGSTLVVPYNTVWEKVLAWEYERERYLHNMYDYNGIYSSNQEE